MARRVLEAIKDGAAVAAALPPLAAGSRDVPPSEGPPAEAGEGAVGGQDIPVAGSVPSTSSPSSSSDSTPEKVKQDAEMTIEPSSVPTASAGEQAPCTPVRRPATEAPEGEPDLQRARVAAVQQEWQWRMPLRRRLR